jgi:DNA-sulfur modification-associated
VTSVLSDITVDDLPPGLGGAKPVELAATRYRQGGRVQYHITIPVAELIRLVQRPDPNRPLQGNRKVDPRRAKKFGEYLLKNNDWVSPAVIVRVPRHEVGFEPKVELPDGTAWGVLRIPLDILSEIVLLDGQHRSLGIFIALELINDRITRLRETISKMKELGQGDDAVAAEERRLGEDIHVRRRLGEEHISIDIAEVGEQHARQMFGDINNNAKGVNPDYTTVLDQRDVVNRIAVQLIESHVLLQDRVEMGQSTRMTPSNENLLGAKGVADIVRAVLVGTGRVGARVEDEISKNMAASTRKVEQFLDVLIAAFDDLRDIADNRLSPRDLRARSMLGSVTMLRVLAAVYHELTKSDPFSSKIAWSRAEVEDFFRKLSPHLRRIPISSKDEFWLDTKAFVQGGTAPMASQGSIKSLVSTMVEWARDGLPDSQP